MTRVLSVDLQHKIHAIDLHYWLDHEEENFAVAPDIAVWARFFCPVKQFVRLIERERSGEDVQIQQARDNLEHAYLDWLNAIKTPKEHKLACLGLGVRRVPGLIHELGKWVAEASITEANEYLYSRQDPLPGWGLDRVVKHHRAWKPNTEHGNYEINLYDWTPLRRHDRVENARSVLRGVRRRVQAYRADFPDELRVRRTGSAGFDPIGRSTQRHDRKLVRRGIDLLADLIGYEDARKFISAREPLVIQGQRVAFRLTLDAVLQDFSHGAMTTEILIDGNPICNLCVYTPDAPPLDHVASVIAHVRAGMEDDLLKTGNPFNIKVDAPTGIASLDEKLVPRIERHARAVVVRHIPTVLVELPLDLDDDPPNITRVIRLSESGLMRRVTKKRAQRIAGYFFQDEWSNFKVPRFRLVEGT